MGSVRDWDGLSAFPALDKKVDHMQPWPQYPSIYEINTWVWLTGLSRKHGFTVNLGSVPDSEWESIAALGFDAVWLMGVWERSPAGIAIANRNQGLLDDFRRALPDFRPEDNVGSPYCVRNYLVDVQLGGPDGLAAARRKLAGLGLRLVLDFVPNHVAPDHPWAADHPGYFIRGTDDDARNDPASFVAIGDAVFACGRDPYFPAWPDVLQLNAFDTGLRSAVRDTIGSIAQQCDGIRCDMAMLLLNSIFTGTWGARAGQPPPTEYWTDIIPAIKQAHPGFLFIAEAYWDLEWELQQKGFDFCYDKRLYDRLVHESAESVRLHLCAGLDYQRKLLRFLENHDEPRAASVFAAAKERAATVVTSTLPGARLFHEGQFEGRKVRPPVFLGRRPDEKVDEDLRAFYARLLQVISCPVFRAGEWSLCERTGWPDNQTCMNLVSWNWSTGDDRYVIVVNLSASPAQGLIHIPWEDIGSSAWQVSDILSGAAFTRNGLEMATVGLFVDLPPWGYHVLCFRRA
jgi:hypothetical protein